MCNKLSRKNQLARLLTLFVAFLIMLPSPALAMRPLEAPAVAPLAPLALLLDENFDYGGTAGNLTAVTTNWTAHSGTTGFVQYIPAGLSMAGYGSSGVGGAATIVTTGAEDVNRTFAPQSSGTVYFGALVSISTANATGQYFLHLKDSGTIFRARVYAQDSGGNLRFRFSSDGLTISDSSVDFAYNTTYLVVAKYDVSTGNAALYVLDAYSATEPGTPLLTSTGAANAMSAVAIRQSMSSGNTPAAIIDGIRVGTSWADAVGGGSPMPQLAISKTANPVANVAVGDLVTYTIALANSGTVSDTNVYLTDTLPAEVDFAYWIDQPSGASGTSEITWNGTLTNNTTLTFTFAVTNNAGINNTVVNTAEFSGTAQADNGSASYQTIVHIPVLSISKSADPASDVEPGALVTYTIALANSGTASDTNVYFTDTLPAEVDLAYWVEKPAGADDTNDEITWQGTLTNNTTLTFTFAVTNNATGGVVLNTAEFSGTSQTGSDSASYQTSFGLPYFEDFDPCPAAGWAAYSVASNRNWGCDFYQNNYSMLVTGYGGDVASNDWLISPAFNLDLTSREILTFRTRARYTDAGTPWPQLSAMYSTNYSGSGDPTLATWTDLSGVVFSPEGSGAWTDSGELDISGINGANVYFAFQYVSSGTGSGQATTWQVDDFSLYARPAFAIAKTAEPAIVSPGQLVTYTITLKNNDTVSDTNMYFTDTLPVEVDLAYWVEKPVGTDDTNDEITWQGTLTNNTTLTFTFAVTNNAVSGTVLNTAEFSGTSAAGASQAAFTAMFPVPLLLLGEIVVRQDAGEYVEIYNPNSTAVDLSDVYLTDATYSGGGAYYYKIVTGNLAGAGGGGFTDFHARFPAGASIAPGEYQVVALAGSSNFFQTYSTMPTYELYEDGGAPDAVPDMLEALPGSINGQGGLSNDGEVVILYYWDGQSDLVTDLDYAVWGDKVEAVSKTGVSIDGPDPDAIPSAYLPDTAIASQDIVAAGAHAVGAAWHHGNLSEGNETKTGGNGADGHNETSENLNSTWCEDSPTPKAASSCGPTPPVVVSTFPLDDATGVSLYRPIKATFSEQLLPATVNTTTFLLQGSAGWVDGSVSYNGTALTASFAPSTILSPTSLYTATLTTGIQDLEGLAMAADYAWSFTTGEIDTVSPTISSHYPPADATDVLLNVNIVITFSEDINPATLGGNVYLTGPSGMVPATLTYNPLTWIATLDPASNLIPTTTYTVTVQAGVADWAGWTLGADTVWNFETGAETPMQAYHGDIHNHTSISDGSGTPPQALAAGKAAGFDFMSITDHSYAIDDGEWASTLSAVEAATQNGEFVALRGFEYTQGAEGHTNVYNTIRHACRSDTGFSYCDYTPNLEKGVTVQGFYPWLAVTGTHALDAAGTVMQFNHPGWINFNDWTFHPEVSNTARLEEVGNGSGTSYAFSEEEYIRSLDYGWKVGATNNADTHSVYWGTNTDHRTGVWMPNLAKTDLLEALRERRTFASEDKNYELYLKANGEWMGQVIPNAGQMTFEVYGYDPDGEANALVQIITNHGIVITETTVASSLFTWSPLLTITPGAHYYYVKLTQADGDRIVSSPIWTEGAQDVSITDLAIEPSISSIYNPSLLTARVTNRGQTTQTLAVTFRAGVDVIDTLTVTVGVCAIGPCSDGYANVTWQPVVTGSVTISANIEVTPAGDNPDDNIRSVEVMVTDERVPLVLIDAGHNNIGSAPRDARHFANDLTEHGYNVLFNLDEITPSDLNTQTVKLLIINAYGPAQFTTDEMTAMANFVNAGGSLWLNGMSDYTGKVAWANTVADRMNDLVAAIETASGANIPIRMNDDEVLDGDDNNGYPWGVLWHIFPASVATGIGMNVVKIQSWSDCSLVDRSLQALTESDLGSDGFMIAKGDQDSGSGIYGMPNRTHNEDADNENDAYLYLAGTDVAGAAGYDIPGQAGRLFFYGDANDPFNIFAYTAGDGKQNELFNLEVVMWLLGEPLHKVTIGQARYDAELNNTPDNLNKLVWVEGEITSGYGEFFNVLYVQDDTGGVTVHAPAGDISAAQYARGAQVRVVGTVGIYQGDTELEFFEAEMVQVLTPTTGLQPATLPLSTYAASLEENEGWLVQVTGTVTSKIGQEAIIVDDGSGPIRAFLDGYNGDFADVELGRIVSVKGMTSEDGAGRRIRVRNRQAMHPELPDDVILLGYAAPAVVSVDPMAGASGVAVTTTVQATFNMTIINVDATTFLLTDSSGAVTGVASFDAGTLTATFDPSTTLAYSARYTATLKAELSSEHGMTLTADYVWAFTTGAVPVFPVLSITKTVQLANTPANLGDLITYTVVLVNSGTGDAVGVVVTDSLPAGVIGNNLNEVVTVTTGAPVQFVITATVTPDPAYYGQTITNTAYLGHSSGNGSASAPFIVIGPPVLSIAKSVTLSNDPALPGDLVTYTIVVRNTGPADAVDVHITDTLPSEVIGADVDEVRTVAANNAVTLTMPVTVASGAWGAIVTNTAYYEYGADSASDVAVFTVESETDVPDLSASTKASTAPNQKVLPGDLITYTITLSNNGNIDANALITDVMGSYYTVYAALNLTQVTTGTLGWSGVVTAGQHVTLQFVVQVVSMADLPLGTTLLNNGMLVDDGAHTPFLVADPTPPWVEVMGIYLPIVMRNF